MEAIVNTKSNYRGVNGKPLKVSEILGTRITLLIPDDEFGFIKADFHLSEIVSFPVGMQQMPDNAIYNHIK